MLPPPFDGFVHEYVPETQRLPFGPELILTWLSHSSIPDQDLSENWSSSICQHILRSFREQRGCIINKSAPCNHPEAMRELKMTGEMQGVAEGLVLFVQIMNWLQRIEWGCCLSNPVQERKSSRKLASSAWNICTPRQAGRSRFSGRTWQELCWNLASAELNRTKEVAFAAPMTPISQKTKQTTN